MDEECIVSLVFVMFLLISFFVLRYIIAQGSAYLITAEVTSKIPGTSFS